MIRYRLKELLAEKEFSEGRRITLVEIAEATGIHRATLSKISNERGYSTGTEHLDRHSKLFECRNEQIVEYVHASLAPAKRSSKS